MQSKNTQPQFMLNNTDMSLLKQQFVVTYRYTILQETEKTWQIFNRPTLKHITFLQKQEKQFFFFG